MTCLIRGRIENYAPFFDASIGQDGMLSIREGGDRSLTVDTGFGGGIALPEQALETMEVELIDFGVFRLANGDEVELPLFLGHVLMKGRTMETWFIPGDWLLGMQFLSSAGSRLSLDFEKEEVELLKS